MVPDKFREVAYFAALEVLLRGTGEDGKYNYTVHDVLIVTFMLEHFNPREELKKQFPYAEQAKALFDAYIQSKARSTNG